MDIIKTRSIRSETELLSLAAERAEEGLMDLKTFDFLYKQLRSAKSIDCSVSIVLYNVSKYLKYMFCPDYQHGPFINGTTRL